MIVQTFLPYADFRMSAEVLDRQRLGKQRVEAWQILRALRGETRGWTTHPATRMWAGYEEALAYYASTMCEEWIRRGYKDTMLPRFLALVDKSSEYFLLPDWFGEYTFHASHRANLLRKDYDFYSKFGWTEDPSMPYVWPDEGVAR